MQYIIAAVLASLTFLLTKDFPFFWDSIQLASKQASHIFYTGSLLLPDSIDSGHPPGFGAYLALWWKALGRELWVSHLAMWPINFLLFYQLIRLCRKLNSKHWYWLFAIALLEPVLLGQLCLMSPDLALLALFLLLLNSILPKGNFSFLDYQSSSANEQPTIAPTTINSPKFWLIFLATLGLSVISTRAWVAAFVVFLVETIFIQRKFSFKSLLPYALGGLPAIIYLVTHYMAKGWVGYHENSPWIDSLATVGMGEMLFNIGILGWRLLDYGRVFLWLILAILLVINFKHFKRYLLETRLLFALIVLLIGIIALMTVPRSGMIGPRYLLPGIILFDITVIHLLLKEQSFGQLAKKGLLALGLIGLLSGSFWVYPFRIAQAWDATPLHAVYYPHYEKAVAWCRSNDVDLSAIGTVFPSEGPVDDRLLNGMTDGFSKFAGHEAYIFVAGVHNDYSDEALDNIEANYDVVASWQRLGVSSFLYHRSSSTSTE